MKIMKREQGFTLIELIVVIAIIGILAAVAVPAFINVVDNAHQANMDAVEGSFRSAVTMAASKELMDNGTFAYPANGDVGIGDIIAEGFIPDWSGATNVWTYAPGGNNNWGTLTYEQGAGGDSYTLTPAVL